MVLHLAKIDSGKDLREAYDFCPLLRGFPYLHFCPIDILLSIDRTAHLNQPDLKHTNLSVSCPRIGYFGDRTLGWIKSKRKEGIVNISYSTPFGAGQMRRGGFLRLPDSCRASCL